MPGSIRETGKRGTNSSFLRPLAVRPACQTMPPAPGRAVCFADPTDSSRS